MKTWLLDTGPLVAYLDGTDAAHASACARLDEFSGALATTGAVVTETMHFVSADPYGPELLGEFVQTADVQIYESTELRQLRDAVFLMKKYVDTPMDFADATLVLLAERLDVVEILTLDRRGFSAFRTRTGRRFRLVLDM